MKNLNVDKMGNLKWDWVAGILGLVGFIVVKGITQPLERDWVELLILLAVMVLLPVAMRQWGDLRGTPARWVFIFSSWALLLAFLLEPSLVAALLSLPLLLFSIWTLGQALQKWLLSTQTLPDTVRFAAYLFWPVATLSAFSDRLGWAPLGFSPIIILLTAAHFHYTGFLLLWVLSKVIERGCTTLIQKAVVWIILLGIPAVAVGITASNFGADPLLETLAATLMALGGLGLAVWHGYLAFEAKVSVANRLGYLGLCFCLSAGMVLALLYGWRTYFPLSFLSIPWMYALHGTLNSVGVGILGVLVWKKDLSFG